jgi:hypothetical protein
MENGVKALMIAAAVLITIAIITLGVIVFQSGQEAASQAQKGFSDLQSDMASVQFAAYEQKTVSGSQVSNAIRKYMSNPQFGILVKTGKNTTGTWYGKIVSTTGVVGVSGVLDMSNVYDDAHQDYVNPVGQFKAQLVYDSNRTVRAIIFTQK